MAFHTRPWDNFSRSLGYKEETDMALRMGRSGP
jgi:hypothetical protein